MSSHSTRNARRTALRDLRFLVTTLSLTAIIGLWNLFSRPDQQGLAAAESDELVNAAPLRLEKMDCRPCPLWCQWKIF